MTHLSEVPARSLLLFSLLLLTIPLFALAQKKMESQSGSPGSARATNDPLRAKAIAANSRVSITIEQPGALVPFFERLYHLSAGDSAAVHIVHFGDSHSAADDWTAELRRMLKERFGDGGSGFSLAGKPFPGYRRFDVQGGGSTGWHADGLRPASGDGYFGLGGISSSTRIEGQSIFIETECDLLEIDYLQQPDGGDLALYDRDRLLQKFSTKGEVGPGFALYQPVKGTHRFVLKTLSAKPVRLFGWVADKDSGVTYETLGINGAEASVILRWDENMLATYLRRRDPGLIVLAYGTNEAISGGWTSEKYQAMFSNVLLRIRRAIPNASILILGPPDSWSSYDGSRRPAPGVDRIISAQKAACREIGCAFWDTRERMGGAGSMRDWVQSGFAQHDYIHMTNTGYRRLGTVLFSDIMRQYELFKKVRSELSSTVFQ
jgi:GDSL-like Lipase/Acylhydrolase family